MTVESFSQLSSIKKSLWQSFLKRMGLEPDSQCEQTVLILEDDDIIATGSRQENLLKCIAVDPAHQGEGLLATVITALREEAFRLGHRHLFLYTKPGNEYLFSSLFFYPVAKTDTVLLMESRKNGIRDFLAAQPHVDSNAPVGALVMNCNPFTLGHRHLIETAAGECSHVYVFVLSEDKSFFSAADRMEMVKLGTADLPNVTVLPTGPYLISSTTFPTYFLKEREKAEHIHCLLDIAIFCKHFVPSFGITHRYVGTEPLSPMTDQYNQALAEHLPKNNIVFKQIPRLEVENIPVSASAVRQLVQNGDTEALKRLVSPTTLAYLQSHIMK